MENDFVYFFFFFIFSSYSEENKQWNNEWRNRLQVVFWVSLIWENPGPDEIKIAQNTKKCLFFFSSESSLWFERKLSAKTRRVNNDGQWIKDWIRSESDAGHISQNQSMKHIKANLRFLEFELRVDILSINPWINFETMNQCRDWCECVGDCE